MKDQKEIVHKIYMDLIVNRDSKTKADYEEYLSNKDEKLKKYGLNEKNTEVMKEILKMY